MEPAGYTSYSTGMIFGAEHLEGIDPVPQPRAERSRGPASRPPARSPHLFGERKQQTSGNGLRDGGIIIIVVGVRRRKPTRADGSRVSRKRQAAGRATYYRGEKEAAQCPLCQESVTVFFTKSLGHGRMEPACECNISRSCCYNCLYDWAVLHALERGRVIPDAATSTYPTGPLRCVSCKQVATRLLRLSSQGTVTSDVAVPYEFPSAAVRGEMARAAQQEHDQPASWLRLVRPMKPPADIAAQEADFRCIPFTP